MSNVTFSALKQLGEHGPDLAACARLVVAWEAIVGTNLAHHLWPVKVDNHVVTIEASSGGWLSEARFMEDALLANIAREVPRIRIDRIRFRLARKDKVGYPVGAPLTALEKSPAADPELALEKVELPGEVEAEIDRIVGQLDDEPLRENLRRIFRLSKLAELARSRREK